MLKTAPCHLSQTEIHLLWQHSSHPGPVNSASQRRRRAVKPTRHLARGRGTSTSGPICMTRPGRRASESSTPNTSACKLVCINPLYRSPRKNAGDPQVVFLTALWGHFSERGAKKQKRCELLPQRPSSTTILPGFPQLSAMSTVGRSSWLGKLGFEALILKKGTQIRTLQPNSRTAICHCVCQNQGPSCIGLNDAKREPAYNQPLERVNVAKPGSAKAATPPPAMSNTGLATHAPLHWSCRAPWCREGMV